MDEDDELYREMNEEDYFYMGNQYFDNNENEDTPTNSNNNHSGCLGISITSLLILFSSNWI